jgi:hypothetical protein
MKCEKQMDEDDNGYNTMTYLTWCAEVQICLTIFRTFYFFLTELLWDHKFFPNVTGCQKTQASDCNKFHCINPYLLILISKATPVSACIGRCSNRITVSFNATFTLLKTEVKQKFDEAPSHKSVMIINHIQIVSAKIVLNQHRFPLPH